MWAERGGSLFAFADVMVINPINYLTGRKYFKAIEASAQVGSLNLIEMAASFALCVRARLASIPTPCADRQYERRAATPSFRASQPLWGASRVASSYGVQYLVGNLKRGDIAPNIGVSLPQAGNSRLAVNS
jgi:hypothetical protein